MLLKEIIFKTSTKKADTYPLNLPWFLQTKKISFSTPVTILVGDNGSGKSSLMEAIALSHQAIAMTGQPLLHNPEYAAIEKIEPYLSLHWQQQNKRGFFFRADDFISFIRETQQRKYDAQQELDQIDDPHSLARIPYLHTLYDLAHLYPIDLDKVSHGEAFLEIFKTRFRPNGLYLLDEPEAPLTSENQLSLIYLIHEAVLQGAQFIIATHSPIIMAYPKADIIQLSDDGLRKISYDQIPQVSFLRNFLDSPERYFSKLFSDSDDL
ncbi:AAA family ATPase [Oenococcus sp.]|uniref:AAA family ATPase n=1 Tax=Oenococcus sp. TaxID=1979414 RepID=UPI0039E75DF6